MASCHLFDDVSSRCRRRTVPSLVVALVILGFPADALAQERQVLGPAQQSPVHSTVDMSTLRSAGAPGPTRAEVKPFRARDSQGLERWKESIRQSPDTFPPAPGFVRDRRTDP